MSPLLFLAGDVMTGRGIDQVLPHPGEPRLQEPWATSALDYVHLAERANGPVPRSAPFPYVWGAALGELERRGPDARIVNLETAVTHGRDFASKGIHYRMSPENLPVLAAAKVDAVTIANNHVLDFGEEGLLDTLHALDEAGLARAGAGGDADKARAPAVLPLPDDGRVLLFARAASDSGVPPNWAALPAGRGSEAAGVDTESRGSGARPGIAFLPRLSRAVAEEVARDVAKFRRRGDIVVLSIHWGPNWGYRVDRHERAFAHRLIEDAGVDVVFGHSSHHPRPVEVHRGRLILYGCGDFLNDYEGIGGHEGYRPDLVTAWFVRLRPDGTLAHVEMVPFRLERFRLVRAPADDAAWLRATLEREGGREGAPIRDGEEPGTLRVEGAGVRGG